MTILIIIVTIVAIMGFSVLFGAPYVPTRQKWARQALSLANLSKDDLVVDLGSGDGAILKLVAEHGARAVGYEINPILYLISKIRLAATRTVLVALKNYWTVDLPADTTIIYAFCVERDAAKMAQFCERQARGTRVKHLKVITFGFELPDKVPIRQTNYGANLYIF